MLKIIKFLKDYNIPYYTSGPNTSRGWVNIKCPFCNDPSNHGGFDIKNGYYNCRKCGYYKLSEVIKGLTNLNDYKIRKIIKDYQSEGPENHFTITSYRKELTNDSCSLPPFSGPLKKIHKDYLIKRNFDPDELERIWNLHGTDDGPYKFRIIAPIYLNGKLISYQGRDITNKSNQRYKACSKKNEVIHHKHALYGIDKVKGDNCVVVEGITDVWRLGPGAIATFGTGYTNEQVLLLAENFKKVYFLFDTDSEAKEIQYELVLKLHGIGIEVYQPTYQEFGMKNPKDPAELTKQQAKEVMKILK